MRELELKFALSAPFDPSAFLDVNGVAGGVVELPSQDLRATYYDTDDLRLARNGATLRFRMGEGDASGWCVKLPGETRGKALTREELQFDGVQGQIPTPASAMVTPYVRSASLRAVATLKTNRKRWTVVAPNGRELAVLTDDSVSVLEGRRVVARFRELEAESVNAKRSELKVIGRALKAAGAVSTEPIPKVVRALGARATAPGDFPQPREVSPDDSAGLAVAESVSNALRRLTSNDSTARVGDPEGVHQMRVAARRLRSDLRTFSTLVDERWATSLIDELKWLAGTLGAVRDLDVLKARIDADSAGLEKDLQPMHEWLSAHAETARSRLAEALIGDRYRALLERIVDAAGAPVLSDAADKPCRVVLPPLVDRSWRKLEKNAGKLGTDATDEELHKVRIRAKRARYAAEAVSPFLDDDESTAAAKFAARAARLQDVLGLHQDAVVTIDAAMEVARGLPDNGPLNLAIGRLIERQRSAATRERERWPKAWNKLNRRKVTWWLTAKA